MLSAQSVPRSTDTSAEATEPLANSSFHDHWSKRAQLSIRRILSRPTLTLAILDGKLSLAVHSRCYGRLGSDPVNWRPLCLRYEVWPLSLQESDGVTCSMRQCPVLLKDIFRISPPGISGICLAVASLQGDCRGSIQNGARSY